MDVDRFNGKAGALAERTFGERKIHCFIPKDAPLEIKYDNDIVNSLGRATHKIGELSGTGIHLRDPDILITPYMQREALTSSRIEGARITISDLYKLQAQDGTIRNPDAREVVNHIAALRFGLKAKQETFSMDLLKEMHKILLSGGVRGHDKNPGLFRSIQNYIGFTPRIEEASFIPPPPEKIAELMSSLEGYINRQGVPPLIQAALAHYQFETIHPFADGNGRIGRALIILMLCQKDVIKQPLLYLSEYFDKFREEYQSLLLKVNEEGCYEEWVRFFLAGVEAQSEDAIQRATKLYEIREDYIRKLKESKSNIRAIDLVDSLFNNPFITVTNAQKIINKTYPTAKKLVMTLVKAGVLAEAGNKEWNKMYCAEEILRALDV